MHKMVLYRRIRKRFIIGCTILIAVYVFVLNVGVFIFTKNGAVSNQSQHLTQLKPRIGKTLAGSSFDPRSAIIPVVIVAYMRSGSTFLGNIIQHDPSVFYVFEPLRQIEKTFFMTMKEIFGETLTFHKRRPSMITKTESLTIYRAWFKCDMETILSAPHRRHLAFFKLGHKTKTMVECLENAKWNGSSNETCIQGLQKACLESKRIVIKTIRTPLDWLYDLMVEFPKMKIIHLVRDPRAIANSLRGFEECHQVFEINAYLKCMQFFCSKMEDDLTPYDMFKSLFPGRIFRIYYEDVAMKPVVMAEKIYARFEMTLSNATRKYVHNITNSGHKPSHELDTVRANSSEGINIWQTKLEKRALNIVQSFCAYTLRKLHYHV